MDQGSGVSAAELVSLRIGVRASKFAVGDYLLKTGTRRC